MGTTRSNAAFLYREKLKSTKRLMEAEAEYNAIVDLYRREVAVENGSNPDEACDGTVPLPKHLEILALQRADRDARMPGVKAQCAYFISRITAMSTAMIADEVWLRTFSDDSIKI